MNQDERIQAEVEEHANAVFGRLAGNLRHRRPRRSRLVKEKPPQRDWFSGVEAALPRGDRE